MLIGLFPRTVHSCPTPRSLVPEFLEASARLTLYLIPLSHSLLSPIVFVWVVGKSLLSMSAVETPGSPKESKESSGLRSFSLEIGSD